VHLRARLGTDRVVAAECGRDRDPRDTRHLANLPPAAACSVRAAHDLLEAEYRVFADGSVALGDPTVIRDLCARLLAPAGYTIELGPAESDAKFGCGRAARHAHGGARSAPADRQRRRVLSRFRDPVYSCGAISKRDRP